MTYETTGISILTIQPHDLGQILRAQTTHLDKVIQCYVSGRLVAWQRPRQGVVEFVLTEPVDEDLVALLAVDEQDGPTSLWEQAFGAQASYSARILLRTPQHIDSYAPGDRWKAYRGEAGDNAADVLVHDQEFYPGGRRSGGWGKNWGYGGWGWSGYDCVGWGSNWGYGEWGFDCELLTWTSEALASGTYPVKITVEDAHGNESVAHETTVTIATYPRPASEAAVESLDKNTDTLVLSFTASEDLNP